MEEAHVFVLRDIDLGSVSIYSLMRYLSPDHSDVLLNDQELVYPIEIAVNEGLFSKQSESVGYPNVRIALEDDLLTLSCTCSSRSGVLCFHQLEVLDALLKREELRVFFDADLRMYWIRQFAKDYGLADEDDILDYFHIALEGGKAVVRSNHKALFRVDKAFLKDNSFVRKSPQHIERTYVNEKSQWILALYPDRLYDRFNFAIYLAEKSQAGKLKNPVIKIDLTKQILYERDIEVIRFLSALLSCQHNFSPPTSETEMLVLKAIVANPLGLDVVYHDGHGAEKITVQSLFPVKLLAQRPELKLKVLRKDPFYELSSALYIKGELLSFADITLKNGRFIFLKGQYIYVPDSELLRVIHFLKSRNGSLLIHRNKFDAFKDHFLTPIEDYVQIDYDDFYASPVSTVLPAGEDDRAICIIYLQKEGDFIILTPVVKYADVEIPTYSKRQLYVTDAGGNTRKMHRDESLEQGFVSLIKEQHDSFEGQLQESRYFYLHNDKFFDGDWFLDAFELWRRAGIIIMGFNSIENKGLSAYKAKVDIKVHSGKDWFNVHVKVNFGGKLARLQEIKRSFKNKSRFVHLDDGSLGILPDEWMNKISRYFSYAVLEKELLYIPKSRFSEIESVFEKELLSEEVREEINVFKNGFYTEGVFPTVSVSNGLRAVLRDYQQEGLNWLCHLDRFNFGGCLADDMGLGKTVQVIAFLLYLKEKGKRSPHLIVLPTSLLFNWQDELTRFSPDLNVLAYVSANRKIDLQDFVKYDVILVSYGILMSDLHIFKKQSFDYVFLDEAQFIKNPSSARHKAVCLLRSRNRIALTGTPVENSTFDIYGIFSFVNPGLLGNRQYFKHTYAVPIDQFDYNQRMMDLEKKIRPFLLRRTKKQVANELPDKCESVIYCEMGDSQRAVYADYEEEVRGYLNATSQEKLDMDRLHILACLTHLRQICNSPALLTGLSVSQDSVKIEVLLNEILIKMKDHKILVFSQFVGMLDLLKNRLDEKQIAHCYLTGESKDRRAVVDEFQKNDRIRVFLISLKAGGVGLNLTEADYVFLIDPWWNPAVENQAIDRSYRIGQHKKVTAVRLICMNTIEEKIIQLQQRKKMIAENLIVAEQSWFKELSKQELLSLLSAEN